MDKMVRELNEQKLEGFVTRILDDLGAAMIAPLVRIGDELGLYSTLAEVGTGDAGRTGAAHWNGRAHGARMAQRPCRRRLSGL